MRMAWGATLDEREAEIQQLHDKIQAMRSGMTSCNKAGALDMCASIILRWRSLAMARVVNFCEASHWLQ